MSKSLLIVAGEASGDLHGANLARELRKLDPSITLFGSGGPRMREAGVEILHDPTAHASVGLVEAFQNLRTYTRLYAQLQSAMRTRRPDAAVLIDSPDFNLPLAGRAKDHNIPVIYYVSPQIWAWRAGRIRTIKRVVRKMIVILEFEEKLYRDAGIDVAFVGHPLLDALQKVDREAFRRERGNPGKLIGLLPGSRRKQFRSLFPIMRETCERIAAEVPGTRGVVGCAPQIDAGLAEGSGIDLVRDRTPEVMASSDLLLVASGTATLEAAIYGTPMLVTYRLNPVTAYLLGPIVYMHTKDFSLVNIVAGKRIMPEFYQAKAKPALMAREAVSILTGPRLEEMRQALRDLRPKLGEPGASRRAAEEVLNAL